MASSGHKVVDLPGREGPMDFVDPYTDEDSPEPAKAPPAPLSNPVRNKPLKIAPPKPQGQVASMFPAEPSPIPDSVPGRPAPEPIPVIASGDGRKVAFLLAQYKAASPLMLYTVAANWDRQHHGLMLNYGDAFVIHSRNTLATRFLRETNFEWGLFVDDDMILPAGNPRWFKEATGWTDYPDILAGVKTVDRLMSHRKKLVGALYFGRNHRGTGRPMYAEGMNNPAAAKAARNLKGERNIVPTAWLGTGCLLVHRDVLNDIVRRFPHLVPDDPKEAIRFFSPAPDGVLTRVRSAKAALQSGDVELAKKLLDDSMTLESLANAWAGEDVVFTTRARMSGHQPYVDFGCICGHVGSCVWGPSNTV